MARSKLKLVILIAIVLFISYKLISFFSTFHIYAAGKYPYAETYYIKSPEKKILEALEKMHLTNLDLKDENTTDYWHNIYFDLGGKRIEAWTRPSIDNGTDFALVAVHKNRKTGWQLVNQELGLFQNIMLKREFEKEIVEKLKAELEK
ncbi:hypothetical protein [Flavobacterium panacagri]|uniref:hypothetical protein n=1 Tax=Flavobacterium panacagri TaxID=3034146 RepID=UPI0025A4FD3D|nr:hypothetical protein [Flavobacterium panacagri]